jgi:hypothetical protein
MRSLLFTTFLAAAATAACNPYDPDLGAAPFRCGADDACPDGYSCVEHSPSEKICERAGDPGGDDDDDGPDASQGIECNDDSQVEPNDMTTNAVVTSIPSSGLDATYSQLAICPDTDKDVFRFGVQASDVNIRATVSAHKQDGELRIRLMAGDGSTIGANGAWIDDDHLRIIINNLSIGTFYAEVSGVDGATNNYELELVTCTSGGSGCPDPA